MRLVFKNIFRGLCLMLCFSFILGFSPALAADSKANAKVTRLSTDWVNGYYVEYEWNGRTYRSDEMSPAFNQGIWRQLDEQDRRAVMRNFAFAPEYRKSQFGSGDASKEMTDWANDVTGWTHAAEVLKDRIAHRDFPELTEFYTMDDPLPLGFDFVSISPYKEYVPEVANIYKKFGEMNWVYDLGKRGYEKVVNAKVNQTSIAVKCLSGDLISLISDQVLVPVITPGGTAGFINTAAQGLFYYIDKANGITDDLYDYVIGERISARKASIVIDNLWSIIETNAELSKECIKIATQIRDEIKLDYPNVLEAVAAYEKRTGKTVREHVDDVRAEVIAAPDPDRLPPPMDEEESQIDIAHRYWNDTVMPEYEAWVNSLPGKMEALASIIEDAQVNAGLWPNEYNNNNESYRDFKLLAKTSSYQYIIDEMPGWYSQLQGDISYSITLYEAYLEEVNNLIESERESMKSIWAKCQPVAAVLGAGYNLSGALSEHMNNIIGCLNIQSNILTLQERSRMREQQYADFWAEKIEFEKNMREMYNGYKELQDNLVNSWDYYAENRANRDALVNELPAYVNSQSITMGYMPNTNSQVKALYAGMGVAESRAEFARIAAELKGYIDEYELYERRMTRAQEHIKYYEAQMKIYLGGSHVSTLDQFGPSTTGTLKTSAAIAQEYTYIRPTDHGKYVAALYGLQKDFGGTGTYYEYIAFTHHKILADAPALRRMTQSEYEEAILLYDDWYRGKGYFTESQAYSYTTGRLGDYFHDDINQLLNSITAERNNYIPVDDIEKGAAPFSLMMSASDVSLPIGETTLLYAAVSPTNATFREIIWESLDIDIAEVDGGGVVTGLKNGTARIIARAEDSVRTEANGVVTYSPAPVEFLVKVGSGISMEAQWDSYFHRSYTDSDGSPIYHSSTTASGTLTAEAVLKPELGEDETLVMALYNASGQMLALSVINTADGGTLLRTEYDLQGEREIRVKIFALSATGSINPAFHKPITGTVNIGEDAYELDT